MFVSFLDPTVRSAWDDYAAYLRITTYSEFVMLVEYFSTTSRDRCGGMFLSRPTRLRRILRWIASATRDQFATVCRFGWH